MAPPTVIPPPQADDDEEVSWALTTATALWGNGEHAEGLRWLRRAAEAAADLGADDRALALFKAAADASEFLSVSASMPPPAGGEKAEKPADAPIEPLGSLSRMVLSSEVDGLTEKTPLAAIYDGSTGPSGPSPRPSGLRASPLASQVRARNAPAEARGGDEEVTMLRMSATLAFDDDDTHSFSGEIDKPKIAATIEGRKDRKPKTTLPAVRVAVKAGPGMTLSVTPIGPGEPTPPGTVAMMLVTGDEAGASALATWLERGER
jgi:hypothetical protein